MKQAKLPPYGFYDIELIGGPRDGDVITVHETYNVAPPLKPHSPSGEYLYIAGQYRWFPHEEVE